MQIEEFEIVQRNNFEIVQIVWNIYMNQSSNR